MFDTRISGNPCALITQIESAIPFRGGRGIFASSSRAAHAAAPEVSRIHTRRSRLSPEVHARVPRQGRDDHRLCELLQGSAARGRRSLPPRADAGGGGGCSGSRAAARERPGDRGVLPARGRALLRSDQAVLCGEGGAHRSVGSPPGAGGARCAARGIPPRQPSSGDRRDGLDAASPGERGLHDPLLLALRRRRANGRAPALVTARRIAGAVRQLIALL